MASIFSRGDGDGGGCGGGFVPELVELRFAKGLVSCPVDDFGGGDSTIEGFLSTAPGGP